jgi:hypothetical protein
MIELDNLTLEANSMDSALSAWSSSLPEDWVFASFVYSSLREEINSFLYDDSWVSYATHRHAVVWNRYRAIRLIVNSIRVRLHSSIITFIQDPNVNKQLKICRETINSLTTDLCRSVGFFLISFHPPNGDRGARSEESGYAKVQLYNPGMLPKMATVLAWPLAVANSIDAVPPPQKRWLQCTLHKISDIIGAAVVDALSQSVEFHL